MPPVLDRRVCPVSERHIRDQFRLPVSCRRCAAHGQPAQDSRPLDCSLNCERLTPAKRSSRQEVLPKRGPRAKRSSRQDYPNSLVDDQNPAGAKSCSHAHQHNPELTITPEADQASDRYIRSGTLVHSSRVRVQVVDVREGGKEGAHLPLVRGPELAVQLCVQGVARRRWRVVRGPLLQSALLLEGVVAST